MRKKTVEAKALSPTTSNLPPLASDSENQAGPWMPVASTHVYFSSDVFKTVCQSLAKHPEWTSSSILRCDTLDVQADGKWPAFEGYELSDPLRRKILPKRTFDEALEQDCLLYDKIDGFGTLFAMLPRLSPGRALPYYHPQVAGLAFRLERLQVASSLIEGNIDADSGLLQIDMLPLESASPTSHLPFWPEDSRTYRTALHLLSLVKKHGESLASQENYVKRVHHDMIVPRDMFQDVYLPLKKKYTWIFDEWREATDPMKHVFEDVGIAAFLICLWKQMYASGTPPGGFVDVGCGNGLLVYILLSEGYAGHGFDLRARKSWQLWGEQTPLRTTTLSPAEYCLSTEAAFPEGSFLIGNHADELTPWLPLLASRTPNAAFLNIPCCAHTFTDRFTRQEYKIQDELLELPGIGEDMRVFESLASEKGGRYAAYLNYIAEITIRAGWRPEREALRIPSTKNWAFVGRRRIFDDANDSTGQSRAALAEWIQNTAVDALRVWKPRVPEGKDH